MRAMSLLLLPLLLATAHAARWQGTATASRPVLFLARFAFAETGQNASCVRARGRAGGSATDAASR